MRRERSLNHRAGYNRAIRAWVESVIRFAARIDKRSLRRRPCPVCGSTRSAFFADNGALGYERCGRCALVFMNPSFPPGVVEKGFKGEDRLLKRYFAIMRRHKSGPAPRPDPAKDAKLKDVWRFKKAGRLLDVGCSVGDFLRKAAHFYDVEGVEVNPVTAKLAARDFTVRQGTLDELELPPVYDVVTLHQILYGVRDPLGLIRECGRVLKPGGLLYINTPNADSLAMALYGGKANHLYGYTTLQVFNRRSLETLARRAGFKLKTFRTEWLDVYAPDLVEFVEHPKRFIHKRNSHLPGYERLISREDSFHARLGLELGNRGNYLVAVLQKK